MAMTIPNPVIGAVAKALSERYTHAQLDVHFRISGVPGDPPPGSKLVKCQEWLMLCNQTEGVDPLAVLGKLLEDFMERLFPESAPWATSPPEFEQQWVKEREYLAKVLAHHGLAYFKGGYVRKQGESGASCNLEQILKMRDFSAVDAEFRRALDAVDSDPPAGLTAACALIESICKIFITDRGLEMPSTQTVKPLWQTVSRELGLDPAQLADDDLKKILSGLSSIVDGLGAFRTHAGSAHGRGRKPYRVHSRHARLAINAANTLAVFVLETWDAKKR